MEHQRNQEDSDNHDILGPEIDDEGQFEDIEVEDDVIQRRARSGQRQAQGNGQPRGRVRRGHGYTNGRRSQREQHGEERHNNGDSQVRRGQNRQDNVNVGNNEDVVEVEVGIVQEDEDEYEDEEDDLDNNNDNDNDNDNRKIDEEDTEYEIDESGRMKEYYETLRKMDSLGLIDIGGLASWKLSSFRPGFGAEALRDNDPNLFWQSDGPQPHHVDLHFAKRMSVKQISIYCDYTLDESYTPSKIVLYSGTGFHDLQEVSKIDLSEPVGWSHIELGNSRNDGVIKTFLLRLTIVANHQNGKDTHLRALKVYSLLDRHQFLDDEDIGFNTIPMLSETSIR